MNKKNLRSNIVAQNRKASFNYFFEDTLEAGIELLGSEVKSLRSGKGSIADSYALDSQGEIYLHVGLEQNLFQFQGVCRRSNRAFLGYIGGVEWF